MSGGGVYVPLMRSRGWWTPLFLSLSLTSLPPCLTYLSYLYPTYSNSLDNAIYTYMYVLRPTIPPSLSIW